MSALQEVRDDKAIIQEFNRDGEPATPYDPRDSRITLPDGRVVLVRTEMLQPIPMLWEREIRDNMLVEMVRVMEQSS